MQIRDIDDPLASSTIPRRSVNTMIEPREFLDSVRESAAFVVVIEFDSPYVGTAPSWIALPRIQVGVRRDITGAARFVKEKKMLASCSGLTLLVWYG